MFNLKSVVEFQTLNYLSCYVSLPNINNAKLIQTSRFKWLFIIDFSVMCYKKFFSWITKSEVVIIKSSIRTIEIICRKTYK